VTAEGLVIRHTKFGKSRLLPLHGTTRTALDHYLARRGQEAGAREFLFFSKRGRQLHGNTVRHVFSRLVRSVGIAQRDDTPRPRLRDLRFYFANQVLTSGPTTTTASRATWSLSPPTSGTGTCGVRAASSGAARVLRPCVGRMRTEASCDSLS
jgi:integrase